MTPEMRTKVEAQIARAKRIVRENPDNSFSPKYYDLLIELAAACHREGEEGYADELMMLVLTY